MAKVFISYRRDDAAGHAGRLFDRLTHHLPDDVIVMDVESITPGDDFVDAVSAAAVSSDVVIVVIGRRWLTTTSHAGGRRIDEPNDIVRLEVRTALAQRTVRVIPALVDGAAMPDRADLPPDLETLARLHAVELSASRFDHDVQRLVERLRQRSETSQVLTPQPATSSGSVNGPSRVVSSKYYVYVSDQKVDMLYAQIPQAMRTALHSELDMPLPSGDPSGQESDRYPKVAVVSAYIERNFEVGTVDDPRSYFRGVHEMRWGPYGKTTGWAPLGELEARIVYFGGTTEKKTHFGLGGGLHHVIGNQHGKTAVGFHSSTPHLVTVLGDELQESSKKEEKWWNVHQWMVRSEHTSDELDEVKSLIAVMNANAVKGPKERLEFLAKKLIHRRIRTPIGHPDAREEVVLLGSPIYVALAHDG